MKFLEFFKKQNADLNGFISNSLAVISSALLNISEGLSNSHPLFASDLKTVFYITTALAVAPFIASVNRPQTFYKNIFSEGATWRIASTTFLALGIACDPLRDVFNAAPPYNTVPAFLLQGMGLASSFFGEISDEVG